MLLNKRMCQADRPPLLYGENKQWRVAGVFPGRNWCVLQVGCP